MAVATTMRYRTFGRLGWQVSEIGLGTWGMGSMWGPSDDVEAIRAIHRALELGVNFIDTAMVYGEGHVETLVGQALAGRSGVHVATKVPPKNREWPARHEVPVADAFPASWIIAHTEQSLRRLRVEAIDVQQLHVWSPRWLFERDGWWPAVERLKRAGKIRAFGVSVNDHEPETGRELVGSGLVASIQVIFNLFDQAPAESLLPACLAHNVAVIARVPFDEGGLTGQLTEQTLFSPDDWRAAYFRGDRLIDTVRRARALEAALRPEAATLAQGALKFCLSHPAVSTVIPGMRRVAHVEENCAASDGVLLSAALLEQLRAHAWPRNFYQ